MTSLFSRRLRSSAGTSSSKTTGGSSSAASLRSSSQPSTSTSSSPPSSPPLSTRAPSSLLSRASSLPSTCSFESPHLRLTLFPPSRDPRSGAPAFEPGDLVHGVVEVLGGKHAVSSQKNRDGGRLTVTLEGILHSRLQSAVKSELIGPNPTFYQDARLGPGMSLFSHSTSPSAPDGTFELSLPLTSALVGGPLPPSLRVEAHRKGIAAGWLATVEYVLRVEWRKAGMGTGKIKRLEVPLQFGARTYPPRPSPAQELALTLGRPYPPPSEDPGGWAVFPLRDLPGCSVTIPHPRAYALEPPARIPLLLSFSSHTPPSSTSTIALPSPSLRPSAVRVELRRQVVLLKPGRMTFRDSYRLTERDVPLGWGGGAEDPLDLDLADVAEQSGLPSFATQLVVVSHFIHLTLLFPSTGTTPTSLSPLTPSSRSPATPTSPTSPPLTYSIPIKLTTHADRPLPTRSAPYMYTASSLGAASSAMLSLSLVEGEDEGEDAGKVPRRLVDLGGVDRAGGSGDDGATLRERGEESPHEEGRRI